VRNKNAIDDALENSTANSDVLGYLQLISNAIQAGENSSSQKILLELERLAANEQDGLDN
jgi:hypothetical protein